MFTGLIEEIGRVQNLRHSGEGARLTIHAPRIAGDLSPGESISVDGVCLTVVGHSHEDFEAEAVAETLQRSTLSRLVTNDRVNLERALQPQSRLGGHFVQGHVDGTGQILSLSARRPGYWLQVEMAPELIRFVAEKGSIAIDGVSLTVAGVNRNTVDIALIPHTSEQTTLGTKRAGDRVNIEVDILSKYVYQLLKNRGDSGDLTQEQMRQWGYE
ncbi:riboflavin synthase [candidate division KSB1 bacterium]|nr:riboflavin synthase [candidate division KSB1 bacterium]